MKLVIITQWVRVENRSTPADKSSQLWIRVLYEWFTSGIKLRMQGHCFIARFANNFIIGCQNEDNAKRIMQVIPKRFGIFELTIHSDKTKLFLFEKSVSKQLRLPYLWYWVK